MKRLLIQLRGKSRGLGASPKTVPRGTWKSETAAFCLLNLSYLPLFFNLLHDYFRCEISGLVVLIQTLSKRNDNILRIGAASERNHQTQAALILAFE